MKVKKINISTLNKIIQETAKKFKEPKETEKEAKDRQVDVGEDSKKLSSLEKKIDFIKALKIKEAKLTKALREVRRKIKSVKE